MAEGGALVVETENRGLIVGESVEKALPLFTSPFVFVLLLL